MTKQEFFGLTEGIFLYDIETFDIYKTTIGSSKGKVLPVYVEHFFRIDGVESNQNIIFMEDIKRFGIVDKYSPLEARYNVTRGQLDEVRDVFIRLDYIQK